MTLVIRQKRSQKNRTQNKSHAKGKKTMKKLYIAAAREVTIKRIVRNTYTRRQQDEGIQTILNLCNSVIAAETHDETLVQSALAVGYANAMKAAGLIQSEELTDLIGMIGQIGEDKLKQIDSVERNIIMRHIRKKVKA